MRSILSKINSVVFGVVKRMDTDAHRMPVPTTARVLAITANQLMRETLFRDFVDVFATKVGKLDGK